MSVNVVVPPSSISRHPSRVPHRTNSGVTFLASAGKMYFSSQSCSFLSSAMPRNSDMAAWVCVLIRPGARIASPRSSRCFAWNFASISARVPTPTMRAPVTATAPFSITRCCASSVMTHRALQIQSAGAPASVAMKKKKLQIRCIEGLREKFFQTVGFGFAAQVHQDDVHVAAKFPENLPARAARRGQYIGIGRHRRPPELAHAFRDGFKYRYPLGANSESIRRILHIAARMDAPVAVLNRRAHFELRIRREGMGAGGQRGVDERVGHTDRKQYSPLRRRDAEFFLYSSPRLRVSAVNSSFQTSNLGSSLFRKRTSVSRTRAPVSSTSW